MSNPEHDSLIVSVSVNVPRDNELLVSAELRARHRLSGPSDRLLYSFGLERVEGVTKVERQAKFEECCHRLRRELADAGVDTDFVLKSGAKIVLYVTLDAAHDDASFSITPAVYKSWLDLSPSFRFDVDGTGAGT